MERDTTNLVVAKNTLVFKANEGTKWKALKSCIPIEIPYAIKPYRSFHKQRKLEDNDFAGAVFEGPWPARAEVYAKMLGALQSPALNLVSTLQAPAIEVVMVLKAYVKKLEDESMIRTLMFIMNNCPTSLS
ncbi:hypothetical protein Bca4012_016434 [Brassica carinata]